MIDDDDEILQDFMVEASEILEQLSQQLIDLERSPDDSDLLNAIFRGFHTVKGGAGFLQFDAMVDICHVAENVFDALRKSEIPLTADLMDSILRALDCVMTMFDEVRANSELTPATPELINILAQTAKGIAVVATEPVVEAAVEIAAEPEVVAEVSPDSEAADENLITDDEFESLLDALQTDKKEPVSGEDASSGFEDLDDGFDLTPVVTDTGESDEITEDEFEALLAQLSSQKKGGAKSAPAKADAVAEVKAQPPKAEAKLEVKAEVKAEVPMVKKPIQPSVKSVAKPAIGKPEVPKRTQIKEPGGEATVRVDTKRLDDIMNMVGELVLVRNRLVRLGTNSDDEAMAKAVSNLDVVTADLQSSVMKTRMQPIKKVFGRFPRVVRDLARNLEKEINLELVGEETDLDKNLVEALADPLVHLVRNSVDHGIETPDERVAAGKDRVGTIVLSAEQEGDHILLVIKDDGKGMDPNHIREIAIKRGAIDRDSAERLSDKEVFSLIFAPGFSTKETVSDVSGRGVGMDVVKTKIAQLNGTVDIESEINVGTRIIIKVPLTLAIMPTLMVMLADQTFALPLVSVNEIFHLDLQDTNVVDGQEVIIVRDKALPLYYLSRWLVTNASNDSGEKSSTESHVVIVTVGNQKVGFVVDQLIGQEEVVIKPLGKMLQGTDGMAGATITGDGTIALILDVPSMLKRYS